ncbi:MAG TPA: hemolysin family protein [Verrucomicrobiae bacterium]
MILIALKILAVLALVLLNAFFVAAELAFVRIRDTQLAPLAAKGNRRARRARNIVANIDSYIGATQLGITLVSLALGITVEPVFRALLDPIFNLLRIASPETRGTIAIIIGFLVNCFLLIIIGELVPKAIAIRRTLPTALLTATPLNLFYRISFPFIWLLHRSSQLVLRWLGFSGDERVDGHSEEELRVVLASAKNAPDRRNLILNALDLRQRTVLEVMRPRHEIVAFNTRATIAECLALAEKTRYSRFPLCDGGDLDKTFGVVNIKDLYALREKAQTGADLLPAARKLIYVPETARLEKLLQLFLDRKSHFAVVVDEYGGTTGVVTLENILEALVGQIQDEFDSEKSDLARVSENVWETTGTLALHDLEKIVGTIEHDESVATVSGWLTQKLNGFPKTGDTLTIGSCELRVEEMDGARVARLKITRQVAVAAST